MSRLTSLAAALSTAFALAACQPMPDATTPRPDTCNLSAHQSLVGTPVSLAQFPGVETVRIIPPNSPVTMDYLPERLNVETDAKGTIQRLSCG